MVAIRISNALRAARTATPCINAPARSVVYRRSIATTPRVMAQQGYGDGSEDPQSQPGATKAQEKSEHPGPAPPDVGKGTGGGPTKANKSGGQSAEEAASASSGGSRSKEAKETGSSPTGGSVGGGQATGKGGEALKGPQGEGSPQPKIMNQSVPGAKPGLSEEQKQEVEQHNVDFDKRHDRAAPAADDKVNQKFWNS